MSCVSGQAEGALPFLVSFVLMFTKVMHCGISMKTVVPQSCVHLRS